MMARLLLLLGALLLVLPLASCADTVETQVIAVQSTLPEREQTVYRVQDRNGAEIGRAVFTIAPENGLLRLTQDYRFGDSQTDKSSALVSRESMQPRSSERTVRDGEAVWTSSAVYEPARVSVTVNDGATDRVKKADISESAYDNLESLFLWRTLPMGAGERVVYGNVVVDPKRGTISRVIGSAEVSGREFVQLPNGETVEAWRVDFTSAGITNSAWYAITPDRTLLKYNITRGPTLLLTTEAR